MIQSRAAESDTSLFPALCIAGRVSVVPPLGLGYALSKSVRQLDDNTLLVVPGALCDPYLQQV